MIASDDEQRTWEDTSSSALKFAGLAGIRPLAASAVAALLVVASAAQWTLAPFLVAACGFAIPLLFFRELRSLSDRRISTLTGSVSPVGSFVVPRALLAVAAFVGSDSSIISTIVLALILSELSIALSLRTFMDRAVPVAVNLPGFTTRSSLRVHPSWAFFLSGLPIAFLALSAVWASTLWVSLGMVVLVLIMASLAFVETALLIRSRLGVGKRITRALTEYAPEFVLHWKAPRNTQYQVEMWLPHLEESGAKFFVLVRDPVNFSEVSRLTSHPVVLRETLNALDDVIVPSLKAALYVNTATVNNHLLRYQQLTHIQLNHGDSEKVTSYNQVFRAYDRNFVAGQAAVDRFVRNGVPTAPDFFELVGRPQTAKVQRSNGASGDIETVLYAPSWHGFYNDTNYSSLRNAELIVSTLLENNFKVIFRPHPYSLKDATYSAICERVNNLLAQASGSHIYGSAATSPDLFDLFNSSDMLIGDVSSVVSDYIASTKPIVLINQVEGRKQLGPIADAVYIADTLEGTLDRATLQDLLDSVRTSDPLAEERIRVRDYLLTPADNPTELFASTLLKYL